jgi:hypothetical protein
MQKDASYHKSAIQYNEELADFAEDLAGRLEHEEVARWARSVSKQHRFHFGRHQKALHNLEHPTQVINTEDGGEDRVIDDEQIVHRSAESGQYVTEDFAENNPATTVSEVQDIGQQQADFAAAQEQEAQA